jgi:receptor expression-enhancing protein 1/2/3/4
MRASHLSYSLYAHRRIPFYYFFKMVFLLFLALPQTQGSTFIYQVHVAPLLQAHENQIDAAVSKMKTQLYTFLQERFQALWEQATKTMGIAQQHQANVTPAPNAGAANPPTLADPLSGAAQMVSGWWTTYAPAIIANGAAYIASRQQAAAAQAAENAASRRNVQAAGYDIDGPITGSSKSISVEARRAALQAELAALDPALITDMSDTIRPSAGDHSPHSSSSSVSYGAGGVPRRRTESGVTAESSSDGDATKYEKIAAEDVGSGGEDSSSNRQSGWFSGWGAGRQGYERVKSD